MTTITINEKDVVAADAYLSAYLTGKIPQADFSQGSVLRDFVVEAIAQIFAFFRAEIATSRAQQSILALQQQLPSADVDAAVDAILSNIFISRNDGTAARVSATLHFSNRSDVLITPSTRFYTNGLIYSLDQTTNLFIAGTDLRQVLLSGATAAEYVTTVTLVCSTSGAAGNIPPGRFTGADRFSAYFTYAENLDYGLGGGDVESTTKLIARAPTALSVRNLVNVRSVQAVLLDLYPTLTGVLTAGFGDPEMTRDRSSEGVTNIDMHTGGYMDVYVKLPPVTATDPNYVVGAAATRADGIINVFYDANGAFNSTTTDGPPVVAGDVLKLQAGIPGAPREFLIKSVGADGKTLYVSERAAFAVATTGISYSIGAQSPLFSDKRLRITNLNSTGATTSSIQKDDCVFLTGRPHGKIRKLELSIDSGATWSALSRVNVEPVGAGEYCVTNLTPGAFQSNTAVERVSIQSRAGRTQGTSDLLRVTYDTLSGFDVISAKVTDSFERNVCANNSVRGYIPVYVSVIGKYALTAGSAAVDNATLNQAIATFITDWDTTTPLDVSAITTYLRATFPVINRFYDPVTLFYTLYAPDGQMYEFQTTDVVEIFPDGVANVSLRGAGAHPMRDEALLAGLRSPGSAAFAASLLELQGIFADAGVTRRSVRFFPDADTMSLLPYID